MFSQTSKKKKPKIIDHFYCPTCNYAARNQGNVTTHIKRHHPGHNQVDNEYQKLMPHFLLFADDIAFNGRNEKETQQLLDIIGKCHPPHQALLNVITSTRMQKGGIS